MLHHDHSPGFDLTVSRIRRMTIAMILVVGASACASTPSQTSTDNTAPTTTVVDETTTIAPTTTPSPSEDEVGVLQVGDDGWFPWLFPSPTLSWYEDGCQSVEQIGENFMSNLLGDAEPTFTELGDASDPMNRQLLVHSKGEDGFVMEGGTILNFARIDPGVVDCAAWGILSAESERVMIDDVSVAAGPDGGAIVNVAGAGNGFEATIEIRVHDESYREVAAGFGMGGAFDVQPFAGTAELIANPIDSNLIVIASSSSPADGSVPQFAAAKARCCGDASVAVPVEDSGDPFAVINVANDDTLNVRATPGVTGDIVATLSPFLVGMQLLDDAPVDVDGDIWVKVADVGGEGVEGWVNEAFITEVESEALPPASLMMAAFDVREALSRNSAHQRLADVVAGQGGSLVRVSAEAFFSPDDQLVDLWNAYDSVLLWGFTDGQGEPIEMTVAEFFSTYAMSPALTQTERVAVDTRLRFSNTIDNMAEVFPEATIIEFHFGGSEGDQGDFDWATLRLGFEPTESGHRLVAIATDTWTI
jgi:hypothetical protein